MTSQHTPKRASRLNTVLRRSAAVLIFVLVVLAALYAMTPFLVAMFAPRYAARLGLDELELSVGYPGLRGVRVDSLDLSSDAFAVHGESVGIEYGLSGLWEGAAESVTIGLLEVSLLSGSGPGDGSESLTIERILPAIPVRRVSVQRLELRFPETGFFGVGQAELGDNGLSFSMQGREPDSASRLVITASLSREGLFTARMAERDTDDAGFLSIRGSLGDNEITIEGEANLSGFPLQLVSELAGLPAGAGSVTGRMQTRLPWPLRDAHAWRDLEATLPSIHINWQSADGDLALQALTGSARLNKGDITALLSGALRYRIGEHDIAIELPDDYPLQWLQGTLSGAAGPQLKMTGPGTETSATLRSFSMSPAPNIEMRVDADIDGRFDNLHATGRLRASLLGDLLGIEADLKVGAEAAQGQSQLALLAGGAGTITTVVEAQLPRPLSAVQSWQDLTATIPSFAIGWVSANNDFALRKITGSAQLYRGNVAASVSGALRYRNDGRDIRVQLPGDYALAYKNDTLTGAAGLNLRVMQAGTEVMTTLRSFSLSLAPRIRLDLDATVDVKADSVRTSARLTGLATLDENQRLAATGTLTAKMLDKVPFTLDLNLTTGAGTLTSKHSFDFLQPVAAAWLPDWDAEYDLDAAHVDASLSLSWLTPERIAADVVLVLADGRAHYGSYRAAGIAGRLSLRADDIASRDTWKLAPTTLSIKRMSAGTAITDIRLGLSWSGDRVAITEGGGSVLGGRVKTTPFAYDIPTGSASFELALAGIDLASVLALEGDDIVGTGILDGTLPVIITNNVVRIDRGSMASRPPGGVIRLTPKLAGAAGHSGLSFALVALKDFSYTSLRSQIDYAENGDLTLAVRLEGRNPQIEQGRPIHYNLNISENVPVLLESLRLKDRLTESIENKLIN